MLWERSSHIHLSLDFGWLLLHLAHIHTWLYHCNFFSYRDIFFCHSIILGVLSMSAKSSFSVSFHLLLRIKIKIKCFLDLICSRWGTMLSKQVTSYRTSEPRYSWAILKIGWWSISCSHLSNSVSEVSSCLKMFVSDFLPILNIDGFLVLDQLSFSILTILFWSVLWI